MENYTNTTLRDYVRILFRQKWVIIITCVTVITTVFLGLKLKTRVYEAQVKMLISAEKQIDSPYYRDILGNRNVEIALTQSEIVKSNPVIERVVKALKLYERPLDYEKAYCTPFKVKLIEAAAKRREEKLKQYSYKQRQALRFRIAVEGLKKSINVEPVRDTNIFTIATRDYSPVGAAIIANVVSRSYVIFDLEQQLAELQLKYGDKHLAVRQLKDNIRDMEKDLNGEPVSDIEAIGPASVKIIEQASVPLESAGPSKMMTFILAVLMAPVLGIMLAFIFEYMDHTFRSPSDMETCLGIPFLGSLPRKRLLERKVVGDSDGTSTYIRAYRNLADQIYLLIKDKEMRSLVLSSTLAGEGTTAVTANLALYMSSKLGHRVLVMDANFRHPMLHKVLKKKNGKGLSNILAGDAYFNESVQKNGSTLSVLTAGNSPLNPITLLDTPRMAALMKDAREKYDIILIDAPQMKDYKDAAMTASYSDGMVLVIEEGYARKEVVKSVVDPLLTKKVNILGAVLNNRTFEIPRVIYERV